MAPLLILLIGFVLCLGINQFILKKPWPLSFTGRLPMSIMLFFTGIAHFTNTGQLLEMMPAAIPWKEPIVYCTGLLEWLAAVFLISKRWSRMASLFLILFFLAILPANIVGSLKSVSLGGMAKGPVYLYFRIPLQLFFMLWVYIFGIRLNKHKN